MGLSPPQASVNRPSPTPAQPNMPPGQGMPALETVKQQHETERTIGCAQIAAGVVRYPSGAVSGTVLSVLLITQPVYYLLLSMNCCCKQDLAMALTNLHLKAIGFCFRGFKTEEQCKKEGCC
ncbi:MAG: hypothetical protein HWD61_09170 [Parachlamydiaceae bacterium]|nr:MAG: hypothetical protein HWD61_09170 [Parachlamydiaceae bacterium]